MKKTLTSTFFALVGACSLSANGLDGLLQEVRAGKEVSISKEESRELLAPAFERFRAAQAMLYLDQVKASLVDPENHGGWPCRSHWLSDTDDSAKSIFEWLSAQFARDEDALYLYARICPAIVLEKDAEVDAILEQLKSKDAFLAERAIANVSDWRNYLTRTRRGR